MLRRFSLPYAPSKNEKIGGGKETSIHVHEKSGRSRNVKGATKSGNAQDGLSADRPHRSVPRQKSMSASIPRFRRSSSSCSDSVSIPQEENNDGESFSSEGAMYVTANERRKLRRERHQRAVMDDLVDTVCDIYAAESKVLNRFSAYGSDPVAEWANRHDVSECPHSTNNHSNSGASSNRSNSTKVKKVVRRFIHSFPPRYALGIDSPGEVLLHMRQLTTPKSDPSKAAVHIVNLSDCHSDWSEFHLWRCCEAESSNHKRNICLVTIAFAETTGVLNYITTFLESGGSQIIDADFMRSTEKIILSRFVVDMKGGLRLEKLQEYIEVYLSHVYGHPNMKAPNVPLTVRFGSVDPSLITWHSNEPASFHPAHIQSLHNATTSMQGMTPIPLPNILSYENSELDMKEAENISKQNDSSSGESGPSAQKRRSLLQRRSSVNFELSGYSTLPPPGSNLKSLDNLMVTDVLREGQEVNVYRGYFGYTEPLHREGKVASSPFALKVATDAVENNVEVLDELRGEIKTASCLDHPNICKLFYMFDAPRCVCLAYEFCSNGSLFSLLADSSRTYDYLPLVLDIVKGMCYLHSKNIIHRDLKPGNIFLDSNCRAKISDFGMSVPHTGEELTGETGTYRWMAPEVIRHEPYSRNVDVYSFGIILWQLVTRSIRPFAEMTPIQTAFAVAKGQRPSIPKSVPDHIRQIITACWDEEHLRRPSFSFVSMALADYATTAYQISPL